MVPFRRHLFQFLGATVAVVAVSHVINAQTASSQPVRIIVPCAVGTPPDLAARIMAKEMAETSGQQAYVENFTAGPGPIDDIVNKLFADDSSILFNVGDCS